MQVHIRYHHGSPDPKLQKIIDSNVRKLTQLLVRFSPDLVHLHGALDFSTANHGSQCSLNLWLPTARLNAGEQGRDLSAAVRSSFAHLEEQVKKHKQVLRREGEWKRKGYRSRWQNQELEAAEVLVEDRQDLRAYLDQVLPQLRSFIEREARFQRVGGVMKGRQVKEDDILNQVVAQALKDHKLFSAEPAPFHLLLSRAIQALNGTDANSGSSSGLAASVASASDLRPSDHDRVDLFLAGLPAKKRQVYVLHALEGFSYEEAARLLEQLPNEVEEIFQEVSREVSAILRANQPGAPSPDSAAGMT